MVLFVIGSSPSHHGVRLALADQCQRRRDRRRYAPAGNPNCDLAVPPSRQGQLVSRCHVRTSVSDLLSLLHALTIGAPKSVPSIHMRCSTTAILRAKATRAFLKPARLASFVPQLFNGLALRARPSMMLAASKR